MYYVCKTEAKVMLPKCVRSSFRKGIPCGMSAGAAGQFLASPMDLIKVRMQMDGRKKLEGLKPR